MFKRSGEEIFITSKEALYSHLMGYLKTVKLEDTCLEEAMNCLEFGSVKGSSLVPSVACDGKLGLKGNILRVYTYFTMPFGPGVSHSERERWCTLVSLMILQNFCDFMWGSMISCMNSCSNGTDTGYNTGLSSANCTYLIRKDAFIEAEHLKFLSDFFCPAVVRTIHMEMWKYPIDGIRNPLVDQLTRASKGGITGP